MSFTVAGEAVQELAPAAFRRCRDEPGEAAAEEILGLIRMGIDGVQIW